MKGQQTDCALDTYTSLSLDGVASPLLTAAAVSEEGLRVLDLAGSLVDQPYVVQIWLMANAVFVWMGSGADKPRLRCATTANDSQAPFIYAW